MKFYAHSVEGKSQSDWHRLNEHLIEVGSLAEEFASHFKCGEFAKIAGLLHDVGKYTEDFQKRLGGESIKVDHSTRGAQIAVERYKKLGYFMAYAIAGHHAGLANGKGYDGVRTSLDKRLSKKNLPPLNNQWEKEIPLPGSIESPNMKGAGKEIGFQRAFLIRMIFSCLVDADFLDTERFFKSVQRGFEHINLDKLLEKLNDHLQSIGKKSASNEQHKNILNWRNQILLNVRKKSQSEEPGIFSLTVPTGGGKTLTSLAFALEHAIKHGMKRIIYVIPFTSIIEQNAKVFRDIFKEFGDVVLEHHSSFIEDEGGKQGGDPYQSREKLKRAMENWDAPIIVTTATHPCSPPHGGVD